MSAKMINHGHQLFDSTIGNVRGKLIDPEIAATWAMETASTGSSSAIDANDGLLLLDHGRFPPYARLQ
jgi:hypothetical protein